MIQNPTDKTRVRSTRPLDVVVDLRRHLEHELETRRAPGGTVRARVENRLKRDLNRGWRLLKARPFLGVALISGATFALASTVGVGELMITMAVAYGTYLGIAGSAAGTAAGRTAASRRGGGRGTPPARSRRRPRIPSARAGRGGSCTGGAGR